MNDTYSKIMLTIIAAALCVNAFQNLKVVNPAHASSHTVQRVAICDDYGSRCANVGAWGLKVDGGPY